MLFAAAVTATAAAAAEVTLRSLLDEMVSYETAARWPKPEFTCKQASSYDRAKVAPDKPGWFANNDQGQFIRDEENDGRKERVILDAEGPGCIVRFWLTTVKNRKGTLRIYLDGDSTPTLIFPAYDLLSGDLNLGEALALPHPGYGPAENGGNTLMLPIPYAKHCKVTWEEAGAGPRYYQINYRTYHPGTAVQTFTRDALEAARPLVAKAGKTLLSPPDTMPGRSLSLNELIPAGKNAVLDLPAGPAAVRLLELRVGTNDPAELERALRSTILQVRFDDEDTVWCPATDFFGSGVGINALSSWYRTVHTNGTMICRWVMPYKQSARVTIANVGERPVKVTMRAITSPWNWDDRSMHFHSAWHYEADMQTPPHRDWNYVRIAGRGVYVGDTLSLFNPIATWYGEGDEKIWVDGESFPSHMGTGTEDYYNFSFAPRGIMQTPFANQVRVDQKMTQGHNVLTRTRNLDGIPFVKSLNFDMELMPWKPMRVTYAATTYWYAFPGATSNLQPQPREAALRVPTLAEAIAAAVRPDTLIADFRKTPLPEGWKVEGYAFGSRTRGNGPQQAAITTDNQRQYQSGTLTSPEFTIERDYLTMELGGTFHPEKCCAVLMVDGNEVRRVSPGQLDKAWTSMDVK
ncbi:MAG: glycoside hydrolase family 172 protein, partial [Verrucomicrobiota bacterium]